MTMHCCELVKNLIREIFPLPLSKLAYSKEMLRGFFYFFFCFFFFDCYLP